MHPCTQCGENVLNPRVFPDLTSLNDRLRSQLGPASVQPDEIESILKNVELDLLDYEAEINRLETRALLLAMQKDRLHEYAYRVKTLLSPIRRLPNELLRDIFDLACEMNRFSVQNLSAKPVFSFKSVPAMAISSVCSQWRKNALATPSIWSRISLNWFVEARTWEEHSTFPLFLALMRSVSQPLAVELDLGGSPFLQNGQPHPIIAKLIEQRHRWQTFTLHSFRFAFDNLFVDNASCHFPLLECLCFEQPDPPGLNFWVGKAPNLKKLKTYTNLSEPFLTSTFPKIAHIDYDPHTPDLECFLEANPRILSLALDEFIFQGPSGQHTPHSRMCPQLETLLVRYGDKTGPMVNSAFPSMHCPSLKTLHVEPHDEADCLLWGSFDLFMNFVQRSSFPLTTLSVTDLAISDSNLVDLLRHLPTLVNLTINDIGLTQRNPLTEQFIDGLHAYQPSPLRSNSSPIIPRLRSLTLICGASEFNDKSIVDMIKSRWIPSAFSGSSSVTETSNLPALQVDCLREFTLSFRFRKKENSSIYTPLERLEKNGLRAVVLWGLK